VGTPWRIGLPYGHAVVYQAHHRTRLVAGADVDPDRLEEFGQEHPSPPVAQERSAMMVLIDQLVEALEGGPPPVSNGRTARDALALIVALHESAAANGRRVVPAQADSHLYIRSA
jgi:predicted dehydrogenase